MRKSIFKMTIEKWMPVIGFEGFYEVSNLGNIKSVDRLVGHNSGGKRIKIGMVLKPGCDKGGYSIVSLCSGNIKHTKTVHRIVALVYLPKKDGALCVNHKDGYKSNNAVENLEWVTVSENNLHAFKIGLKPKGSLHHFSRAVIDTTTGKKYDCIQDACDSLLIPYGTLYSGLVRRYKKYSYLTLQNNIQSFK